MATDDRWKNFYERQFGSKNFERFDGKAKVQKDEEERLSARMNERFKVEEDEELIRQIQQSEKLPRKSKRRFFRQPDTDSSPKGRLMKKAKKEFLKCIEVQNIQATQTMKKEQMQRRRGTGKRSLNEDEDEDESAKETWNKREKIFHGLFKKLK